MARTSATTSTSKNRFVWILYAFLCLWRVLVCTFTHGYIHPDEFFQSGQELWFGCPPMIPWEFEPKHALRSILPPTILTWLPLRLYAYATTTPRMTDLSGPAIFVVPRIFCAILSIGMGDVSVWILSSSKRKEGPFHETKIDTQGVIVPPTAVLIFASSWTTWSMLNRPFTNSLETLILALVLVVCTTAGRSRYGWLVGALCAFGLFTRFTFVCYAFPVVLRYLLEQCSVPISTSPSLSSTSATSEPTLLQRIIRTTVPVGTGFLLVAAGIVYVDLYFYRTNNGNDDHNDREYYNWNGWISYLTPWNAFRYNSKTDNLRNHGLHPRWTHAIVNMFLLYGPLTVVAYMNLLKPIMKIIGANYSQQQPPTLSSSSFEAENGTDHHQQQQNNAKRRANTITNACYWTLLSGLCLLSIAPHQEPRFLLPLLVPLVVLAEETMKSSRLVRVVWVVFNLALFGVFGILHQGGVVPSLLMQGSRKYLSNNWFVPNHKTDYHHGLPQPQEHQPPLAVLYFRTYMPPTFLSRRHKQDIQSTCTAASVFQQNGDGIHPLVCGDPSDASSLQEQHPQQHTCNQYPIVDFKGGSELESLQDSLDHYLSCHEASALPEMEEEASTKYVYLVSPPMTISEKGNPGNDCFVGSHLDCNIVASHPWHLTTEDLPSWRGSIRKFWEDMNLDMYRIACRN